MKKTNRFALIAMMMIVIGLCLPWMEARAKDEASKFAHVAGDWYENRYFTSSDNGESRHYLQSDSFGEKSYVESLSLTIKIRERNNSSYRLESIRDADTFQIMGPQKEKIVERVIASVEDDTTILMAEAVGRTGGEDVYPHKYFVFFDEYLYISRRNILTREPRDPGSYMAVTDAWVNAPAGTALLREAKARASTVAKLDHGTRLEALGQRGDWYAVAYNLGGEIQFGYLPAQQIGFTESESTYLAQEQITPDSVMSSSSNEHGSMSPNVLSVGMGRPEDVLGSWYYTGTHMKRPLYVVMDFKELKYPSAYDEALNIPSETWIEEGLDLIGLCDERGYYDMQMSERASSLFADTKVWFPMGESFGMMWDHHSLPKFYFGVQGDCLYVDGYYYYRQPGAVYTTIQSSGDIPLYQHPNADSSLTCATFEGEGKPRDIYLKEGNSVLVLGRTGDYTKVFLATDVSQDFTVRSKRKVLLMTGYVKGFPFDTNISSVNVIPDLTDVPLTADERNSMSANVIPAGQGTSGEVKGIWYYTETHQQRPLYVLMDFEEPNANTEDLNINPEILNDSLIGLCDEIGYYDIETGERALGLFTDRKLWYPNGDSFSMMWESHNFPRFFFGVQGDCLYVDGSYYHRQPGAVRASVRSERDIPLYQQPSDDSPLTFVTYDGKGVPSDVYMKDGTSVLVLGRTGEYTKVFLATDVSELYTVQSERNIMLMTGYVKGFPFDSALMSMENIPVLEEPMDTGTTANRITLDDIKGISLDDIYMGIGNAVQDRIDHRTRNYRGLEYRLEEDKSVTILGLSKQRGNNAEGYEAVYIPAEINGHPVLSIAEDAFAYERGVMEVYIEDGIRSIGDRAFWKARDIQRIFLPGSVNSMGVLCLETGGSSRPELYVSYDFYYAWKWAMTQHDYQSTDKSKLLTEEMTLEPLNFVTPIAGFPGGEKRMPSVANANTLFGGFSFVLIYMDDLESIDLIAYGMQNWKTIMKAVAKGNAVPAKVAEAYMNDPVRLNSLLKTVVYRLEERVNQSAGSDEASSVYKRLKGVQAAYDLIEGKGAFEKDIFSTEFDQSEIPFMKLIGYAIDASSLWEHHDAMKHYDFSQRLEALQDAVPQGSLLRETVDGLINEYKSVLTKKIIEKYTEKAGMWIVKELTGVSFSTGDALVQFALSFSPELKGIDKVIGLGNLKYYTIMAFRDCNAKLLTGDYTSDDLARYKSLFDLCREIVILEYEAMETYYKDDHPHKEFIQNTLGRLRRMTYTNYPGSPDWRYYSPN